MRGYLNVLGLYIQEREFGQGKRLQAGGKYQSYIDAWEEKGGAWQVKKFDEATWNRRFADVVDPTFSIGFFLVTHGALSGNVNPESILALEESVRHLKATGQWLELSGDS